jgi:hypothetical protein
VPGPEPQPQQGPSLTYLLRISPPLWGSTWPGRVRTRGSASGRQRGGDGRGPGCGAPRGEAGAVRRRGAVGGASLTGRPGCPAAAAAAAATSERRGCVEVGGSAGQQPLLARTRARYLYVATAPAPLFGFSQLRRRVPGAAATRLASAGSQDARACAALLRAGARTARARAARARARFHPLPPRASGGKPARDHWTAPPGEDRPLSPPRPFGYC